LARTVQDAKLQTREARKRLAAQPLPHWCTLRPGQLHLGYRKRHANKPGKWLVRTYIGVNFVSKGKNPYRMRDMGCFADDYEEANGSTVLSFSQAQDKALSQQHEAEGTRSQPLTVAEAIADYIKFLRLERKTAGDAEQRARVLILPELGKLQISELTTTRLLRWRDALAAKPARLRTANGMPQNARPQPNTEDGKRARRATVNRTMTILKAALNRAFEHGQVDDDIAWRKLKPFSKVGAQRPGYLTVEQSRRLINAAEAATGFRNLVHAALLTGCRYGELAALLVGDFHRSKNGGKLAIHRSKSGRARDVVLNAEGTEFFAQLTAGRDAGALLLPRNGTQPWRKSEQTRPMQEACVRANISPEIGFHQLRHTWASLAVMNDVPLLVVARNLGHRDTRMVELHYGHLTESYVDDAIRQGAPSFGAVPVSNVKPLRGGR
jgi:integrase